MPKKIKNAIAAPDRLKPFSEKDSSIIRVVIETPKGCQNKYKYDPALRALRLNRVLPNGMVFPYDFGFVPRSEAEDGDPIDVLVLMDAPAFPGCVIESRLIGVIEGEQDQAGEKERNDRLVVVAKQSHTYSDLKNISEVNPALLKEIGEFFVNYHKQSGEKFKVLGVKGSKEATRRLDGAVQKLRAA